MLDPKIQNFEKESLENIITHLYSGPELKCLQSVIQLKNLAIGSNRQKENVINTNVVPRLLQLLIEEIENEELLYEIGALLCTLSKGTSVHIRYMIDYNAIQILIKKITHPNTSRPIIEICLRTLRSLFQSDYAPINTIYETHAGVPFIAYLLNMIAKSNDQLNEKSTTRLHNYSNISTNDNWHIQECILNILASSCRSSKQQNILCQYSCVQTISDLLLCNAVRVCKAGLNLLAKLCYENKDVSKIAVDTRSKSLITNHEVELVELLYTLLDRNETQLYAARCFTNLFRSNVLNLTDNKRHEEYIYKSLKVLIRMCKKENHPLDRIEAANELSYLIELNSNLQRLAAICDHLIPSLADYLTFNLDNLNSIELNNLNLLKEYKKEEIEYKMKEAAFTCFSSLASTDEEIRKKIIETDNLMSINISCLSEDNPKEIKLAALRCLHSLSRSVRQLQTVFQDHLIWKPLKTVLLNTTDDSILSVVSSTLCNLLLEFNPSKPHFLDKGVVEILCALTKKKEDELRLNGVWSLMNMAFQAEQNLSVQILNCLGTEQISNLILKEKNLNIVLKTLGLLRNVLTVEAQIDFIMTTYGKQIMEIIMRCLNDELVAKCEDNEIKEEVLCICANIAHGGDQSKEFILSNEELLKKLHSFISVNDQPELVKLQIATVLCINNLIWNGKDERKSRLKQLGFHKTLKKLLQTSNNELFDKVKSSLNHFSKEISS